jgi:hypothetical protein
MKLNGVIKTALTSGAIFSLTPKHEMRIYKKKILLRIVINIMPDTVHIVSIIYEP